MEIQNKNKENWNLIIIGLVALVIMILFLRGCDQSALDKIIINTPEVKGKFESVKPEQHSILNHIVEPNKKVVQNLSTEPKYRTSNNEAFLQSQIDELIAEKNALQEMFNKSPDSTQFKMYQKAIEPKWFDHTFDDDKLTANVYGTAIGEVKSIKMDYTIKPQKIEATKPKETFLRVLGGGAFGINKELNQFTYSASAGFQNKKGNIIRGQYQKIGNSEFFTAGYEFSILNWKR